MLSLVSVPGIFFHSLFGSRGWLEGVKQTGRNRIINRQKLDRAELEDELTDSNSLRRKVFDRYVRLLQVRNNCPAFHPHGGQQILDCGKSISALIRHHPTAKQRVLCLQNASSRAQTVKMDFEKVFGLAPRGGWLFDLITNRCFNIRRKTPLRLGPYQTLWLVREHRGDPYESQ